MPSKPKFRQSFEEQQANQAATTKGFQKKGQEASKTTDNRAGQENQQNEGQWGEDHANTEQNLSDANNLPVNQHGRDDSTEARPDKPDYN
jgi:hypothetical protein